MTSKTAQVEDTWAKCIIVRALNRIGGKYVVLVEHSTLAKEEDFAKKRLQFQRHEEGASGILGFYRVVHVKPNRDPNQVEVVIATSAASHALEKGVC